MSPDRFRTLGLTPSTYVWKEGMANWTRLSEVPGLLDWLKEPVQPVSDVTPAAAQPSQAYRPQQYAAQPKPESYLVLAILSTVLCCLPTGIYAIICATRVDTYWNAGNYAEAASNSRRALRWSIIGAAASVLIGVLYFLLGLLGSLM